MHTHHRSRNTAHYQHHSALDQENREDNNFMAPLQTQLAWLSCIANRHRINSSTTCRDTPGSADNADDD
ncbi:hypothetical protein Ct61P_14582 [Colletotrichum tofieldiae]|nr:hypothetical protein Ct61P_14582 [Colletotrichum tofieldiae]